MATSGTYNFAPALAQLVLQAFSRIGVRRTGVLVEHLEDARMEANLLLGEWANKGPNLWTVDLEAVPLVAGQATYLVPDETVDLLSVFIRDRSGRDRPLSAMSRSDYADLPNKAQAGEPNSFWFNRLSAPMLVLWPVPTDSLSTVYYYRYTMSQDAVMPNGLSPDIPSLFNDAFVAGLAHRLARIYAPALEQIREADAVKAWTIAATQNVETTDISVRPMLGSYYR